MEEGMASDSDEHTVTNIVVTGKSGAGKQPRIDVLIEEFGLEQLSTGNIFRHYLGLFDSIGYRHPLDEFWSDRAANFIPDGKIKEKLDVFLGERTEEPPLIDDLILGLKAKYFVEKGLFGPDDLVNELVSSAFGKRNFSGMVLDGYPRTENQAEYLISLLDEVDSKIDFVLIVDNDDELIVKRTIGRRICPLCGKVYHLEHKPPGPNGSCKDCNAIVILRSDDSEEKIRRRLQEFREKCVPAISYMKQAGIPMVSVPGNLAVFTKENVRKSVLDAIVNVK